MPDYWHKTPMGPADFESADAQFLEISPDDGKLHVAILWPGSEIARYTGVIVEAWEHKHYGRGKRAYLKEFTEKEREKIGQLHTKAYQWVLRTGHPGHIQMSPDTHNLLVRAANFFATI